VPVEIKARKKTKLDKLVDAYAKQRNLDVTALRIFHNGQRLNTGQSLAEVPLSYRESLWNLIDMLIPIGFDWIR